MAEETNQKQKVVVVHQGRYIRWEPFPAITSRWYLDGLHHDWEGFRVLLRSEQSAVVRLAFEAPLLYQVADESFRLVGPDEDSEFAFPHPFYIVERSSLIVDFHRSSATAYQNWHIQHFAIYTANDCVDVLSVQAPRTDVLGA